MKLKRLLNPFRKKPTTPDKKQVGLGSSKPIPGGERNGDGEPAETYILPEWNEITTKP